MLFVADPVELATGITDAILGLFAVLCAVGLFALTARDPWKARLWSVAVLLLAIASVLGVAQHGLVVDPTTRTLAIHGIDLALGQVIALVVDGALLDRWGLAVARRALPFLILMGLIFFGIAYLFPTTFLPFILYEAVAMLFALGVYISLAIARRPGALLMTLGILVTILAAVVQVSPLELDLIWRLDHNSLFHLVQLVGLALLFSGLSASMIAVVVRVPDPVGSARR
jgi:hypothetical protein